RGVRKLPPGGVVRIGPGGEPAERRWFDMLALARGTAPAALAPAEAAEAVDAELERSVRRQLVADVPVGAFLSGGVDSASVTAAMARAAPGAAHAFTIGFDDPRYDESGDAAALARALGIRHTVLRATVAEAAALVPDLPAVYDEPFADASQLPTLLLCRLARGHVTVALSGDGGDELFGGYRRHLFAARHWPRLRAVPPPLRRGLAALLGAVPERAWDAALGALPGTPRRPGETLRKLAAVLGARDLDEVYARLTTTDGAVSARPDAPGEPLRRFRALDAAGYLHDDVLTKVDRASMSVALEVRVPMLSPPLLRLAFSLPSGLLVRGDGGKAVLRDALARHLPRPLFEREKTGFAVPVADWLRGRLRGWAEAMLGGRALGRSGFVDRRRTERLWRAHLAGRDAAPTLWPVLMLAAWLEAREAR
ncbi:MAG: asparagine synthase-related protein, partial [Acetobacteraceae bacterium]